MTAAYNFIKNSTKNKNHLRFFLSQFASLLEAGLPIDQALAILGNSNRLGALADFANDAATRLGSGQNFTEIIDTKTNLFDNFDRAVIEASELGGDLVSGLRKLSEHHQQRFELNEKLKQTFAYPIILTLTALSAIIVLMIAVVPRFQQLFIQHSDEMPGTVKVLFSLSELITDHGWLVLLILILILAFFPTPIGRNFFRACLRKSPWIGIVIESLEAERWTKSLAILLERDIPLPRALEVAAGLFSDQNSREAGMQIIEGIQQGKSLGFSMAQTGRFPDIAIQLARIGEESGDLEKMLARTGDYLGAEVRAKMTIAITIIEPLVILILGAITAVIVISLMTLLTSINTLIA